ncbi:MAG: response regulator transcription factor [Phycicoccus sp.]|nr:response regulator transcription factor [Phycicoccus sp.]NMM35338.1 response regulator transcription factor [Phycicoccus sp.]
MGQSGSIGNDTVSRVGISTYVPSPGWPVTLVRTRRPRSAVWQCGPVTGPADVPQRTLGGEQLAGEGSGGGVSGEPPRDEESRRIRVLLVDDHPLFRAGVRQRLSEHDPDLEVVGEAGSSQQAQEMVALLSPDVVLMDIAMGDENGIEATRAIKREAPAVAVIILSLYDDVQYIEAAVEAGAAGYFLKTVQGPDLAAAVRSAHDGDTVLSPEVAGKVFRRLLPRLRGADQPVPGQRLSERESEVLALVARGAANKEIARSMGLSVRTIEAHLRSIFAKLLVGSRTEAVVVAVKAGLLRLEEVELLDGSRD